jgi:hypothetical protein
MHIGRKTLALAAMGAIAMGAWAAPGRAATASQPAPTRASISTIVRREVKHDVSAPLRDLRGAHVKSTSHPAKHINRAATSAPAATSSRAAVGAAALPAGPAIGVNFDGIGNGNSNFTVDSVPPDPNGDVGTTQYAEIVNTAFEVFTKTGTPVFGPVNTNTLWHNFGGSCESDDDGDGTVKFDRLADRWVVTQFAVPDGQSNLYCVAVSATADATGLYYRYAFDMGDSFPDYPKLGIWPDGYYATFNMYGGANESVFIGPEVCALDRASMLRGGSAVSLCNGLSGTDDAGLLPADVDGHIPPPPGEPEYLVDLASTNNTILHTYKLSVDWSTQSTFFTRPYNVTVPAYTPACANNYACIPQGGVTQKLDSLNDRLMYRLAYRNFGGHATLVTNHSVRATVNGVNKSAPRWYQLNVANQNVTLASSGTYDGGDTKHRWMGSAALDHNGNLALGYSKSSSTTHPAIAVATVLANGTVTGESNVITGGGSQTKANRWGDYTSMAVDPVDDCTFWYTNEYIPANGVYNWKTRVATFKVPGCAPAWSAPTALGGGLQGSPAVVSMHPGHLDAFVRGGDNVLYHRWFEGGAWSAWYAIPGMNIYTDPTAIVSEPNHIDVFARGPYGIPVHVGYAPETGWGAFDTLGPVTGNVIGLTKVAAAADGYGDIDIAVVAQNHSVWHEHYMRHSGGYQGWESLGGSNVTGDPAITAWPGAIDVFVRSNYDDALWHKAWRGSWADWESFGGSLTDSPVAISWGAPRIDVFARGTDGAVYHKYNNGNGWNAGLESLGGGIIGSPAVSTWGPNRLDVFVRGGNNTLFHKWFDGATWTDYEAVAGNLSTPPAAVSWQPGRLDVFVRGGFGGLWTVSQG